MVQEEHFRLELGMEFVDVRVAGAFASCYGVNLAVAGLGYLFFDRWAAARPVEASLTSGLRAWV
jgi:hypothetical protein